MGNPVPLAISVARSTADDVLSRVRQAGKAIRAYHGSPHNFDRFDASKIGTGEGAQAYGHGLYFAGNEGTADVYRRKLSAPTPAQALAPDEDIPLYFAPGNIVPSYGGMDRVLEFFPGPQDEPWRWSVKVVAVGPGGEPIPYERPRVHRTAPSLLDADRVLGRAPRRPGHMYEVELGVPEESLLDWDRPVMRQAGPVADYAKSLGYGGDVWRGQEMYLDLGRFTPEDVRPGWTSILNTINDVTTRPQVAAARLMEAGIPGIRYLDGNSRAAGQGTHNYVMFPGTEDSITILRKYGLLPPLAAASMQGDE